MTLRAAATALALVPSPACSSPPEAPRGCNYAATTALGDLPNGAEPEGLAELLALHDELSGTWTTEYECEGENPVQVGATITLQERDAIQVVTGPGEEVGPNDSYSCTREAVAEDRMVITGSGEEGLDGRTVELTMWMDLGVTGNSEYSGSFCGNGDLSVDSGGDYASAGIGFAVLLSGEVTGSVSWHGSTTTISEPGESGVVTSGRTGKNCDLTAWERAVAD